MIKTVSFGGSRNSGMASPSESISPLSETIRYNGIQKSFPNTQHPLNEHIVNNDSIFITETSEENSVNSMGSRSKVGKKFFLCLPQCQRSNERFSCSDVGHELPLTGCTQGIRSSIGNMKSDIQSLSPKSFPTSKFTDRLCGDSKFRLTPKIASRKVPLFPSNPSELPRNSRKRSIGYSISS